MKNRLQAQDWHRPRYANARHCARLTYEQDGGVRAFFRGGWVCALRAFPTNAAIFIVYAQVMHAMERKEI